MDRDRRHLGGEESRSEAIDPTNKGTRGDGNGNGDGNRDRIIGNACRGDRIDDSRQ